jgi:hypothetical protein
LAYFIVWDKSFLYIYRVFVGFGKVSNVPNRSFHGVSGTEVFFYGFGFGGGFDDDEMHKNE